MIFSDFFKSIAQLGDPRFRRVVGLGIVLTLLVLFGVYAAFLWTFSALFPDSLSLPILGEVTWVKDLLSFGSIFLMLGLSIFLMVPVASAITGLFLDEVAEAVEVRHYPSLQPAPRLPFSEALVDSLNFLALLVGLNLLAFIVYIIFSPLAPFLFWALNGFLLGREYFQMAAMRRVGRQGAKELRKKHVGQIWFAGILMAMPLSIPLVNLFVPVLGMATFTHLFHRLTQTRTVAPSG